MRPPVTVARLPLPRAQLPRGAGSPGENASGTARKRVARKQAEHTTTNHDAVTRAAGSMRCKLLAPKFCYSFGRLDVDMHAVDMMDDDLMAACCGLCREPASLCMGGYVSRSDHNMLCYRAVLHCSPELHAELPFQYIERLPSVVCLRPTLQAGLQPTACMQ